MSSAAVPLVANAKPSKSLYKSGLGKRSAYQWSLRAELTSTDRLLQLLCLVLLPVSIALHAASISAQDLVVSSGDGQNVAAGKLGYSRICFTGVDSNGDVSPQDCAHIDTSCDFTFTAATQSFMATNYNGMVDSNLSGCSEFNAYRAFHVMAIILAGFTLLMMLPLYLRPDARQTPFMKRIRIYTFCVAFSAGVSGVIAQCLFVDWWNTNQQKLITLGYLSEASGDGSTPLYVTLDHSLFDLVGGWVCSICSALFFVWTFQSATK